MSLGKAVAMVLEQKQTIDVNKIAGRVKTWQTFLLFILMTFVMLTMLRINNVGMIERKNAVMQADKALDAQQVHDSLFELRTYVQKHMNASTGGFYLENMFKRDSQAAIDEAAKLASSNPNGLVYKKASDVCDPQFVHAPYSVPYFECITREVEKYPAQSQITIKQPNPALYRHDYDSPVFSYDWAGMSVVVWFILGLTFVLKLISDITLLFVLKKFNI